jgi:hypothetical protein
MRGHLSLFIFYLASSCHGRRHFLIPCLQPHPPGHSSLSPPRAAGRAAQERGAGPAQAPGGATHVGGRRSVACGRRGERQPQQCGRAGGPRPGGGARGGADQAHVGVGASGSGAGRLSARTGGAGARAAAHGRVSARAKRSGRRLGTGSGGSWQGFGCGGAWLAGDRRPGEGEQQAQVGRVAALVRGRAGEVHVGASRCRHGGSPARRGAQERSMQAGWRFGA